jgi:N-acetylneuraminic acid mutarotase
MIEFSLKTNAWSTINYENNSPFTQMFLAGLSLHDGKLIVFGGINSGFSQTGNEVNEFNFITRCWEKLSSNVSTGPKNRYNHAKTVIGDRLYIYGGFNEEVQNSLNDLWEFELNEKKWRQIKLDLGIGLEKPIQIHACSTALYQQSKLVMIGGFTSNYDSNPSAYVIDFGSTQPSSGFPKISSFVKEKLFADCTIEI